MAIFNTKAAYGRLAKMFHWVLAAMILAMLVMGVVIALTPPFAAKGRFIAIHKSLGLTTLLLMVGRLVWTMINPSPTLPHTVLKWHKILIKNLYGLLYLSVFLIILAGWSMSAWGGHHTYFWWAWDVTLPLSSNRALSGVALSVHQLFAWR